MKKLILASAFCLLISSGTKAQEKPDTPLLSPLFSENAVLQRDKPLPIWGEAAPGSRVEVELAGQKKGVNADPNGQWRVQFPPFRVATGVQLRVSSGQQTLERKNLAFGDVWLCSGQSNMQWRLLWGNPPVNNAAQEIENANYPNLRLLTIPNVAALSPQRNLGAIWQPCTPKSVIGISAVAYFFGREIHQKTGVPIGLVDASWGGTNALVWASGEALEKWPEYRAGVQAVKNTRTDIPFSEQIAAYFQKVDKGIAEGWAGQSLDESAWKTATLPGAWKKSGDAAFADFDGVVWYRRKVEIPEALRGQNARLRLGAIDDADLTFWNGEKIGETNSYNAPREYAISAEKLGAGGTIAVRVLDNGGGGGFSGPKLELAFDDGQTLDLSGAWRVQIGASKAQLGAAPVDVKAFPGAPGVLFNSMIAPLTPAALKGAIWYQGEANAGAPEAYVPLLQTLVADWRARFSGGDFPFYQTQLAAFMDKTDDANTPAGSWAWIRESQERIARNTKNAGLALAIDIGDEKDIHPRNKQDVGARLARLALRRDYGLKIEESGPVFRRARFKNGAATLEFQNARGLKIEGEANRVFAVAGEDKKWFWATPQIEGEKIILRASEVTKPVAVRYAWQNFPRASIFNQEKLPLAPFRTDNWAR